MLEYRGKIQVTQNHNKKSQ